MKTKRDHECVVDEAEPVRCGYTWGEHGEHECDAWGHVDCRLSDRLVAHICRCGADVFVRGGR